MSRLFAWFLSLYTRARAWVNYRDDVPDLCELDEGINYRPFTDDDPRPAHGRSTVDKRARQRERQRRITHLAKHHGKASARILVDRDDAQRRADRVGDFLERTK